MLKKEVGVSGQTDHPHIYIDDNTQFVVINIIQLNACKRIFCCFWFSFCISIEELKICFLLIID